MTTSPAAWYEAMTAEYASLRTTQLVNAAIERAIADGHELDAQNDAWRAVARRIDDLPVPSPEYDAACAEEQRITGRIVYLRDRLEGTR